MSEIIIDRSPEQKRKRLEQLRLEIDQLGYAVVPKEWVKETFWKLKIGAANEKAATPRSNRSEEALASQGRPQIA